MAYKCNKCGRISEEAGDCCGEPMTEEKTEEKTEE